MITVYSSVKSSRLEYVLHFIFKNLLEIEFKWTQDSSNLEGVILNYSDKILPLHPRTSKMMEQLLDSKLLKKIQESNLLTIINPAGFLDMIALEKNAELIITDSGGVQKEAYFFKKPCIILRPQTEWVEIIETKSAVISDTNSKIILEATERFLSNPDLEFPEVFGNGNAASFIAKEMLNQFS